MSAPGVTTEKVSFIASKEQLAWLNEAALARSSTVSDVLRRLIDEARAWGVRREAEKRAAG
jgi:hypothetical protein